MSKCIGIREQMQDHLDRYRGEPVPDAVLQHLEACEDCASTWSQSLAVEEAFRAAVSPESEAVLSHGFHQGLMKRLQFEAQYRQSAHQTWYRAAKWVLLPAAAAAVLAVVINPEILRRQPEVAPAQISVPLPVLSLNVNLEPLRESREEFEGVGRSFLVVASSAVRALGTAQPKGL